MRLIILGLVSFALVSCVKESSEVKVPQGKAVLFVENTSFTHGLLAGVTGSGNQVLMQFSELDGKDVEGTVQEVFDLTVDPGPHTVKILCGIHGEADSSNNSVIKLDTKENHKYVFRAYLKDKECFIKYDEEKP